MARSIQIELEPACNPAIPAFPIPSIGSPTGTPSRDKAIKVVDLLLNAFVEDTLGTKRGGAESAQQFLRDQLQQYRERLVAAETALAEFKKKNVGMIPGEEGGYFQRLQSEQDAVQRAEAALRVAMSRRNELGRQLSGEVPYVPTLGAAGGVAAAGQGPADTATRIQETQARLDDLLLRFTDRHPDVLAAQETLAQLKARQQAELEAVRRGDAGAAAVAGASANPVYQSIQLAINQADVEIATLRGTLSDHRQNVAEMRRALDTAPEVEAEYARLTRDYDVTQTQYNALLQRLEQARVSEDAQETGIVDFDIVDPPAAAFSPVFPNRPLLLLGVFMFAMGAGVGLAWLLDKLRPVFHHSRSLAEVTGLPVIGVVSIAWVEKHRARLYREYVKFAVAAGLLVVASAAILLAHGPGARFVQGLIG